MTREAEGERLMTRAAIGADIGRDDRSARRYETDRGLPPHRLSGAGPSTVYAFRTNLDRWLRERGGAGAPRTVGRHAGVSARFRARDPAPSPRPGEALAAVVLARTVMAGIGAVMAGAGRSRAEPGVRGRTGGPGPVS